MKYAHCFHVVCFDCDYTLLVDIFNLIYLSKFFNVLIKYSLNRDNIFTTFHWFQLMIHEILNIHFLSIYHFLWFYDFADIFTNANKKLQWHTISNNVITLHYPKGSLANWGFEYPIKVGILSIIPVIPHQGWHTFHYVSCLHRVLWMHISSQFHGCEGSIFYTTLGIPSTP